ncbi:hypothetical protein [Bacillus marinisedimentorum]|uniref:hypothetical protein n=1 Tax=Bacillus marinisedimentorum TaxID=1821260 RepID=UPI0007E24EBA|nr:hypothetical protein [Bacillus marinisedimentorum]
MENFFSMTSSFQNGSISITVHLSGMFLVFLLAGAGLLVYRRKKQFGMIDVELDTLQVGTRSAAVYKVKRNNENIFIAHRILMELETRKAAIEIDPEYDVLIEIYASWYDLFTTIRDELKSIPGSHLKKAKNDGLIRLSLDILNVGLRPHLTKYQAAFQKWFETAAEKKEFAGLTDQEIQKRYPEFDEMVADIIRVNSVLQQYSSQLNRIIWGDGEERSGLERV